MKSKEKALIAVLSAFLFNCSQDRIVELPLTMHNGYGPFSMGFRGVSPISQNVNNLWSKTYPTISKFPSDLTELKYGFIETNIYQLVYQNYLLGDITKDRYEYLQKSWNWVPDTINLSMIPVKTQIAFIFGKDSEGEIKVAIDANNNLDLSDDILFAPLFETSSFWNHSNKDSLAQIHAVDVSFETYVHSKISLASAPLFIIKDNSPYSFMCNFSQYATTQFKGVQRVVCSNNFLELSYKEIEVAIINQELETGFQETKNTKLFIESPQDGRTS